MKTTTTSHIPFEATHAGSLLKDELDARNINQSDFAVKIGMHKTMLNEIIKGKRAITADLAIILEKALEIPADYWMRFQIQFDIDVARVKQRNIQRIYNIDIWNIIKEYVPINYFKKLKYLVNELNADILKIKEIYNIKNVEELVDLSANYEYSYFRKSDKFKLNKNNILAWNVVSKYEAKKQSVNKFNADKLPELLNDLHAIFYKNKSSVEQVGKKLNEYGIKFISVPKLEQTPIDGYTFWSEENPAIALTLRYNRLDNFAFTIIHEIGHIQLHLQNDKEREFFDVTKKDSIIDIPENEANAFAQEHLIPKPIWNEIRLSSDFSDANILLLSKKHKIHPAIILGRINFEYNNYNTTTIDKRLN